MATTLGFAGQVWLLCLWWQAAVQILCRNFCGLTNYKAMSQACAVCSPVNWGFERNGDITSTENLVHADLIKHEQPELSLPVWINALASDVSRGFRGICPSSGRFVQWNIQQRQVFVVASLGE
jgi:hypothetical protein